MGQQNIKPLVLPELKPQPTDPGGHLPLGVHILALHIIAEGAPQPQDTDPVVDIDLILDTDAAPGLPGPAGRSWLPWT